MPATHKLTALMCLFALSIIAIAGPSSAADDGRYVARVPLKSPSVYKSLVEHGIEVLAMNKGGLLDVIVDADQLDYLFTLGVPVSVIRTPEMQSPTAAFDVNLGLYHTYAEMETVLTSLETAYPDLADLQVMGPSLEGRNIYVLRITDNVTISEGEPEVLIMANHHAREIMTVEIALGFAVYLLENYGTDPVVTDIVDNRDIYIAPMINPDGHVYVETGYDMWRKNRRDNLDGTWGVDLNRNYGYEWGYNNFGSSPYTIDETYRGTGPFSEPETQAVRDFTNNHRFTMWLSYHSYGELLLYPWGYDALYTPDHMVFLALGDTLTASNGYFAGNTAMGAIYETNGDSDDWGYGDTSQKDPVFAFSPEINSYEDGQFSPPETLIQPTFDLLLPMNILFVQLSDNPYRVMPPDRPTLYAIDESSPPAYVLNWSGNDPADRNPILGYDVVEYKNIYTIQDPANSLSPLWLFDGFTFSTSRAYQGTGSYYSGAENQSSHTLQMATFYTVTAETDSFTSRVWYDIESNYDYAYLEVSTDGGVQWETVPGNRTTNYDPYGNNHGNGITGLSGGWVEAIFPLTDYLGMDLDIRYNYVTDAWVVEEGLYVDVPDPVSTYEAKTLVASGTPDTTLSIIPDEIGTFTYRVRGRDAENQLSLFSVPRTIVIDDLTAVGDTPRLASRLGPNYPNPFNPVTRIPYTVGSPDGDERPVRVRLGIYNVAGQRIAAVVDREVTPGVYEAVWNGRTDAGLPAPSGVYFARLNIANNEIFTRKLVLLK